MDKAVFVRFWKKFATMIDNGVPLVATLATLRDEQGESTLGQALDTIVSDLKNGTRFSECLEMFPAIFGRDVVQITRGGESNGRLDEVAKVIAERLEEGVLSGPSEAAAAVASTSPEKKDKDYIKVGPKKESDEEFDSDKPKQLLNNLITQAIEENASDIHFEAFMEGADPVKGRVRFRIDGLLEERATVPIETYQGMIGRIKVMSALDVGQTRIPQDGRILIRICDERVDMRVAVGPSVFGEGACLRILPHKTFEKVLSNPELVFPEKDLRDKLFQAAKAPYGLFIASGPTGCGKTTTIYSLLAQQNGKKCKIMTAEDPVEVTMPDIHQVQIRPAIGLDYSPTLRHFLRMDPDVIFCSEVRDVETAVLLLKIALTGHLVFTQLHAADAVSTLGRLLDIGLEPYLLADVLIGVVNQRLIRRLCPDCRKEAPEHLQRIKELTTESAIPKGTMVYEAVGCDKCAHTGYRGRRAVYEYLEMTQELRQSLRSNASREEIEEVASASNFKRIFDNALPLVIQGETSLIEIFRVCTSGKKSNKGRVL